MRKKWQIEIRVAVRHFKVASMSLMAAVVFLASAAPASAAYRLSVGDTIGITVFGKPDLSRQSKVDSSGKIWLPTIGRLTAAGRTLEQLHSEITGLLRKDESVRVQDVNVEIAGFRPIFVEGEITNSGAYPYHTGMTVRQVIALAGGQMRVGPEAIDQKGQLRGLWLSYVQRHARIARLKAELALVKFKWTPPDGSPIEKSVVEHIRELEKNRMQFRYEEFNEKLRLLGEAIKFSDREIKEFREQMVWADSETERMSKSVGKLEDLRRRGLARDHRVSQGTQALYLVRFRAGQLKMSMVRAKRSRVELLDQRRQLMLKRRSEITDQLQLAVLEGDKLREQVISATSKLRAMYQTMRTSCATSVSEEIIIHRSAKGKIERISTHRDDAVLPGDVVDVRFFDPSQTSQCRDVLAERARRG